MSFKENKENKSKPMKLMKTKTIKALAKKKNVNPKILSDFIYDFNNENSFLKYNKFCFFLHLLNITIMI